MRRRDFIAALGTSAAWPLAARAQQRAVPVVGLLSGTAEPGFFGNVDAFKQGLGELGYFEGRNVEILYRYAENRYDRLPALASDLVRRRVAVILATSVTAAALAAKKETTTIPIVFTTGADPVEVGLVASLNRPGGNVTGVSFLTTALARKRLELPHEMVPSVMVIGHLINPTNPQAVAETMETELAARILGVRVVPVYASTPGEVDAALANGAEQGIGALLIGSDPLFGGVYGPQIAAWAAGHNVPAMYNTREVVRRGGLMSYGASISDAIHLAGTYVGRILKGDKPADLPVQQSTRIEMALNLKAAKALGIEVPTATLLRADEVIEADP